MDDWRRLHEELVRCPWFSRVGQRTGSDGDPLIKRVDSWTKATEWAEADITWWCGNEASNVLSEFLHVHHNSQYQEWNKHIASFGPTLDDLIAGTIKSAVPPETRTPAVLKWIRSSLTRAYLECVYSPISDVKLARSQLEWYLAGHFPCGWYVEEEAAFPDHAVTILF